jgi:hypothetical protein
VTVNYRKGWLKRDPLPSDIGVAQAEVGSRVRFTRYTATSIDFIGEC